MTMLLLSLSSAAILKGIMVIGDGTDKQSRIRIVGIIVQLSSLPPC